MNNLDKLNVNVKFLDASSKEWEAYVNADGEIYLGQSNVDVDDFSYRWLCIDLETLQQLARFFEKKDKGGV